MGAGSTCDGFARTSLFCYRVRKWGSRFAVVSGKYRLADQPHQRGVPAQEFLLTFPLWLALFVFTCPIFPRRSLGEHSISALHISEIGRKSIDPWPTAHALAPGGTEGKGLVRWVMDSSSRIGKGSARRFRFPRPPKTERVSSAGRRTKIEVRKSRKTYLTGVHGRGGSLQQEVTQSLVLEISDRPARGLHPEVPKFGRCATGCSSLREKFSRCGLLW